MFASLLVVMAGVAVPQPQAMRRPVSLLPECCGMPPRLAPVRPATPEEQAREAARRSLWLRQHRMPR